MSHEQQMPPAEGQNEAPRAQPPADEPREARSFRARMGDALGLIQREGMAFLLLGILALIAAATWYAIARTVDGWVRSLAIGGLVSIAVYVLLRPEDLRQVFAGRAVRYGSNAAILSVATIGIVVLLNYLSTRYYKRFDVTEGDLHSLSEQSIQIVSALDREIEIIGVYPSGQGQEQFEVWIDEYQAHTDQIRYRTLDPIRQPGEADLLGWDAYGYGLIVKRGTRSQEVYTADEQDITSALLKVSRDTTKVVYYISGHNEPSPISYESDGYGQAADLLGDNNYEVRELNLAITNTVPADAAVVVVAGLQSPLLEAEKGPLRAYLAGGGKALIMVDPGVDTGINDVLAPWQVRIENKLVVDLLRGLGGDAVTPVIDRYAFSQITKDLPMVALPLACPIVGPTTAETGITWTPLGETSDQAWADADVAEGAELTYDEGTDLAGPLTLIASVASAEDDAGRQTRIVLVGDADYVVNSVLAQIPNGQFLFLNAVNWLAEEEALIAIGPKSNVPRSIRMTGVQEGAVCFGSLILIPALIAGAGLMVWLKRR